MGALSSKQKSTLAETQDQHVAAHQTKKKHHAESTENPNTNDKTKTTPIRVNYSDKGDAETALEAYTAHLGAVKKQIETFNTEFSKLEIDNGLVGDVAAMLDEINPRQIDESLMAKIKDAAAELLEAIKELLETPDVVMQHEIDLINKHLQIFNQHAQETRNQISQNIALAEKQKQAALLIAINMAIANEIYQLTEKVLEEINYDEVVDEGFVAAVNLAINAGSVALRMLTGLPIPALNIDLELNNTIKTHINSDIKTQKTEEEVLTNNIFAQFNDDIALITEQVVKPLKAAKAAPVSAAPTVQAAEVTDAKKAKAKAELYAGSQVQLSASTSPLFGRKLPSASPVVERANENTLHKTPTLRRTGSGSF